MPRSWPDKFRTAWRGLWLAICKERSFAVHLPVTAAVIVAAAALRVSLVEGCILALCVALVLSAEAFNTAIEFLSREVTHENRAGIAAALDIASGAVLLAAMGAAGIGGVILVMRLGVILGW
jgi:diacylglycerol kinase